MRVALLLCLMMALSLSGCLRPGAAAKVETAAPPQYSGKGVPDWVRSAPKVEGKKCSVGTAEPTYYVEDGKRFSADNCRKELARNISTEVSSVMLDTATEKHNRVEESSVIQTTASVTEAVVENAEVLEYWFDKEGKYSFRPGVTYCLCCVPDSMVRK